MFLRQPFAEFGSLLPSSVAEIKAAQHERVTLGSMVNLPRTELVSFYGKVKSIKLKPH
jgi:hypothetical protein